MQKQNKDVYFQSDTSLPSFLRYIIQPLQDWDPSVPGAALITGSCDDFHRLQEDLALVTTREKQKFQNSDPDPAFPRDPRVSGGLILLATFYLNSMPVFLCANAITQGKKRIKWEQLRSHLITAKNPSKAHTKRLDFKGSGNGNQSLPT